MPKFFRFWLVACLLPVMTTAQSAKIQNTIAVLKELYSNETQDYITDGQRVVWVKSYKKWTPADLKTLKKENPDALQFLLQACEHNRLDILNQLLPDYYRNNGGATKFAEEIRRVGQEKREVAT